jgi:hypothetical protein
MQVYRDSLCACIFSNFLATICYQVMQFNDSSCLDRCTHVSFVLLLIIASLNKLRSLNRFHIHVNKKPLLKKALIRSGIDLLKMCWCKDLLLHFSGNNPLVATSFANWWTLLQMTGVVFPKCPIDAPPIFSPPTNNSQAYGSPRYAAGSLRDNISDLEALRLCPFAY